jgi:diguanylate cyclase (GGDEF)-like protein
MDNLRALPPAASALGVSFDGRDYHYREYSYDRLADALQYAQTERSRPGFHDEPAARHWKQWPEPTAQERADMVAHGIAYEGGRYHYGPYSYELLAAALDYARRAPGLASGERQVTSDGGLAPEAQLGAPQLRLLLTLSRELLQTDDAHASLALVGHALADMIQADSALLVLLDGDGIDIVAFDSRGAAHAAGTGHPLYATAAPLLSGTRRGAQHQPDGNPQGEHDAARKTAVAAPAQAAVAALAARWDHDLDAPGMAAARAVLSCILELGAAALGKIASRHSLERLAARQREQIANTSVAHAAELEQRDRAATEMHTLSLTDVLTGLYNRRGFFVQAEQVFKLAQRRRTQGAVIFADIDGLKNVNDLLGHDAGDSLIRDAATLFRQSFRQADVVARLGGDEFVAFTLDDAQPGVILQRIREHVHAFNLPRERPYKVAFSAGIVQCDPAGGHTLAEYVGLADQQMYAHKSGRLH